MDAPVCLVAGVGPEKGTGAEIARRFAVGGYRVAMLARDGDRLADLEGKITGTKSFPCDIADPEALVATVAKIRNDLGAPAVMVHNAPRSVRGAFLEVDPRELEKNFRVNVTALLYLARETLPAMVEAGKGVILVTGNTGATRGKATHGFFSSTRRSVRRAPGRRCFPTRPMSSSPTRSRSPRRCIMSRTRILRLGRSVWSYALLSRSGELLRDAP